MASKKSFVTRLVRQFVLVFVATIITFTMNTSHVAFGAVQNNVQKAQISFTFDDGFEDVYTEAAPILADYGLTGTSYVTTGCVGIKYTPNNCNADRGAKYMSWTEVRALQNTYGWEVGSHTVTHPLLASSDASIGQRRKLTNAQVIYELQQSKNQLVSNGIAATSIATPYGDYSPTTLKYIARYYQNHRGYWDIGYNNWPHNEYLIRNQQVEATTTVDQVKEYIDTAIADKSWLVLTFHEIVEDTQLESDIYAYNKSDLREIAAYVASKNIQNVNVSDAFTTSDQNLLSNSSFNSGLAGGWTTDSPTLVKLDTLTNGNFPDPTRSIRISSGTKTGHLFSPQVTVNASTTYMLKQFVALDKITNGELGFYIDEYDQYGNWISGQWKNALTTPFVQNVNFSYTPSSIQVKKARLQIYSTANSGITAYVDSAEWFALTTPPVAQPTNMFTNGTFNNGSMNGWSTDNTSEIMIDNNYNGSINNPQYSVRLGNSLGYERHLFSNSVNVNSTKAYSISSFLRVVQMSGGEVGFYIDEYDQYGNWISGQYKGGIRETGQFGKNIQYTPSSSSVTSASLQVIVSGGGANILAYFDDAQWILSN